MNQRGARQAVHATPARCTAKSRSRSICRAQPASPPRFALQFVESAGAAPCTRPTFFAPPKKVGKERRGPNRVGLRPIPEFQRPRAGSAELALFRGTPAAHLENRSSDNCASISALRRWNSARLQGRGKTRPLPLPNPPLCTGEGTIWGLGAYGGNALARAANHLSGAAQPRACRERRAGNCDVAKRLAATDSPHPSPPLRAGEGIVPGAGCVGGCERVRAVAITGTAAAGVCSGSSSHSSAKACTDAVVHAGKREAPPRTDTLSPIPSPETRGGLGWGSACEFPRPSEAPHSARSQPIKKRNCPSSGFRVARSAARKRASFALPVGCVLNAGTLRSRALSGPRLSLVPFFGGAKKGTRVQGGAPAHLSHTKAERGGRSWR